MLAQLSLQQARTSLPQGWINNQYNQLGMPGPQPLVPPPAGPSVYYGGKISGGLTGIQQYIQSGGPIATLPGGYFAQALGPSKAGSIRGIKTVAPGDWITHYPDSTTPPSLPAIQSAVGCTHAVKVFRKVDTFGIVVTHIGDLETNHLVVPVADRLTNELYDAQVADWLSAVCVSSSAAYWVWHEAYGLPTDRDQDGRP